MLSAITFGPNRPLVDYINEMSAGVGDLCVYKTIHSYPNPHELLQLMNVFAPEVVFLDIESSPAGLELAKEVRACHPKTAVIGFCKQCDPARLAELKEGGVTEVLTAPGSEEDFQKLVLQAIQAKTATVADNVIAFLPSKAGSGSTTSALNIAVSLVKDWKKSVLVLEADLHSGPIGALLNLETQASVLDALENSQWMNDSMWGRLVSKAQGVDVLPMPAAKQPVMVSRWEYLRLLTFARSRYDMVLVDLPELVDDATDALVVQAKVVHVIVTPGKASLFLARRRIDELTSRGTPDRRIRIVLNRCLQRNEGFQNIEKVLERPVSVLLPNDDLCFRQAACDSQIVDAESELGKAFRSFARVLAGIEGPPLLPPRPVEQPKTGLRSLFRSRAPSQSRQ